MQSRLTTYGDDIGQMPSYYPAINLTTRGQMPHNYRQMAHTTKTAARSHSGSAEANTPAPQRPRSVATGTVAKVAAPVKKLVSSAAKKKATSAKKPVSTAAVKKTATARVKTTHTRKVAVKMAIAAPTQSLVSVFADLGSPDLVSAVRHGLPVSAVDEFIQSGAITSGEINDLILPRRTLSNRKAVGTLTADQSDKLVRVGRVIAKAEETFGTPEKAHRWLRRPTAALNGEAPLNLLDTEAGARLVEDLLISIVTA